MEYYQYPMMMLIPSTPLEPSSAVCFQPTPDAAAVCFLPVPVFDNGCFYPGHDSHCSSSPPRCLPHQFFDHPPPPPPFYPEFFHAPPLVPSTPLYCYPPPPSSVQVKFEDGSPRVHQDEKRLGSRVKKEWIPKNKLKIHEALAELNHQTTLMIRNIPNQLQRENLQQLLDDHCMVENKIIRSKKGYFRRSAYDFLYLPMDFVFKLNLGYAFVNFTTAEAAVRFFVRVNGFEWSHEGKTKICEICPARIQGKHAMRKRYNKSEFECDSKEFLPAVYSPPRDGSLRSRPMTLGRCTGRPPARQRGSMVMAWRKMRCSC